jgi:hypothetical protein
MISYNISGSLIDCDLSTSLYESDYQYEYNYRLRANYIPNPVVCYKLSGIKSNVAVSLHRLENLEQRYQGDNIEFIQVLSDLVTEIGELSTYIADNQYNITEAINLHEQASSSMLKLQSIYNRSDKSFDFKDEDDTVVNIAMTVAIFASFFSIGDSIKSGSNIFAIGKISSGIAVSSMFVAFLKSCLKECSSPSNKIYYTFENMNSITDLFGEIEEYNANDGMSS